jgi:hypothetical protein
MNIGFKYAVKIIGFHIARIEEISILGLVDALQNYHEKPLEKEAEGIVAGPSFLQFLNKLFRTQISTEDMIQFESGNNSRYYMLSAT